MLIRLIGSVGVVTDDQTHRFSAPKLACVLAALAVRPGEPVEVTTLISRVWGDRPPESAVGVLYSYMARLRGILRDAEVARIDRAGKGGYVLETDPDNIDIHKVRRLAAEASRLSDAGETARALPIWREATSLAHSEAFVGIDGRWAADYRARFRGERLQLLTGRYAVELRLGYHHGVVDEIAEAVAREPMAEPLVEHLMVALYRCGRSAEALDRYESTRVALRDRLGADPGPRLRALHRRILNHDVDTVVAAEPVGHPARRRAPVPAQLPADTTGFLGRETEASAIYAAAGRRRVVVVDGMAGVGKTALALHVAHKLAPEYPDGQLFIDLRGYADKVTPLAPEQALGQLLRSLNTEVPDSDAERSAALRTAMAGRRMVLVLDNARDASQVLPLLPGAGECLTIVTSRRRLVDLTDSLPVSLDTLTSAEAAQLFNSEAGTDGADETVHRIAAVCGHLPLALRIAASRLRTRPGWTAEHLLHRLTNTDRAALRELDGAGHGVVAAFDLSYRELDDDTRRLFRLVALFPGSEFDQHVAATLADVRPDDADQRLERLVDSHLVQPVDHDRYRLHDLVRNYASALIDESEGDAAWQRLVELYVSRAGIAAKLVHPDFDATEQPDLRTTAFRTASEARVWFQNELSTIVHIVDSEIRRRSPSSVADLTESALLYMMHSGSQSLRRSMAQKGAAAAVETGDRERAARFENHIGLANLGLGFPETTLHHLHRALSVEFDPRFVSQVTNNIANTYLDQGRLDQAIEQYRVSTDIAARHDLASAEARALCNMSDPLTRLGRYDEASGCLDKAESIARKQDNQLELARITYNRARIAFHRKNYQESETGYNTVLEFTREHNEVVGELSAMSGLTELALGRGDHQRTAELAQELLGMISASEHPAVEAEALIRLGQAQAGLSALDDAVESLQAAIARAAEAGTGGLKAEAEHALGEVLASSGDRAEAVRLLASATEFFEAGGYEQAEAVRRHLTELTT